MRAGNQRPKRKRLPTISFRLSQEAKAALQRRAALRSEAEKRDVRPGEVAREVLEYGLAIIDEKDNAPDAENLVDDVLASALYSRRALELLLNEHQELSEQLLRACRDEVRRRKHGRKLLGG